MSSQKQYKTLFKATSLFGIVEVLRLFLKLVINFAAGRILGVQGFGLVGLIENTTQLITSFTNFGINFIGIREIAAKKGVNEQEFQKTIKAINFFSIATGLLAAIVSIVLSSLLSKLTFETTDYYIWFILLSVYFVFTSLTQNKIIFLEGTQNFSKLIRINILSNAVNTVVVILSYYFFKINGIIIAMILSAIVTYLIYLKLTLVPNTNIKLTTNEKQTYFKEYIKSGSLMALNVFIGFLCYYVIRIFLKDHNSAYLSYYNVGNIILVSYLGMIFIAMSKYFFPKLTQTIKEKDDSNLLINNQLEMSLLVILPAILIVYSFGNELISLFFSKDFKPAYSILIFGLLSIVFRGFNYAIGYLFLAHKNYKQYFIINALSDVLNAVLSIILFNKIGLYGIGLAILVNYVLSSIYIYFYVNKVYDFKLNKATKTLFLGSVLITACLIWLYFNLNAHYFFIIAVVLAILSLFFSVLKFDSYIFDNKIKNKIKSLF
ncbi:oligosaccharide flippase family protein [Flavobacterium sp. xlx-214]|uniref:oligosaccharide flippase family protein n=1 Tax=unclassified Flavobacterium TaxID=196869 RepID=UPI0013D3E233|nr:MULTISPECIES: oligosaccharide flippase family protein [unclassified Flavobacterium]MBA5791364.1 oligosaccharide flippase family protein [Flavobacterium sp. xlx-221]QMI83483.1 oligosaccharide flippase family protein [Flavobacterium sp. xlx-214]